MSASSPKQSPWRRRYAEAMKARQGPELPQYGAALSNLALLLKTANRLGEAEPLMRKALAIGEKSLGPEHPIVVTRLNELALLLQATNRLSEAELLMRQALAIDERASAPRMRTSPQTSTIWRSCWRTPTV